MEQWFMEAGAVAGAKGPPGTMGPSTHAYGGTRMGDNRETNVVNRFGFSHEVPNLGEDLREEARLVGRHHLGDGGVEVQRIDQYGAELLHLGKRLVGDADAVT